MRIDDEEHRDGLPVAAGGTVGAAELAAAAAAVGPLARAWGLEELSAPFDDRRWRGDARGPVLHLEDVSGIPFVSVIPGVEEYQHRARVRAGDGELYAAVTPPVEGFERYCRERLGLGAPELVAAAPGEHPFAVAEACRHAPAFDELVRRARDGGGLAIHPYMAIEPVWTLAQELAAASRAPVQVLGPPPPVTWIANDKAHFSEVVRRVLDESWLVETHAAADPAAMAAQLARMAERHARAGLKRTRCASAMGNAVYDLEAIARMRPEEIEAEVRRFLERTEWALDEEVLIVAWESTDDSPSTQLWIPPRGEGPPRVAGVYEQLLEGEEKIFLGSRPSCLPATVNRALTDASLLVAAGLQALGYVGRCSFDFIVVDGEGGEPPGARFVECNGRWGGTSTPMRLVDRLVPGRRPHYRAQDWTHHELVGIGFDELCRRIGDDSLYDVASGRGCYVLYNVGPLARSGKFDVIAFGSSPAEAERLIREDLPARLGLARDE